MTKLTTAQVIALSTYLTEWPEYTSFHKLIGLIIDEDKSIIVCDAYSDLNRYDLAAAIESLAEDIQDAINKELKGK